MTKAPAAESSRLMKDHFLRLPLRLRRVIAIMRSRGLLMWASLSAPQFAKLSYSQYAEDIVANATKRLPCVGTYVDVGAAHPRSFSNTYYFYRRGWSGINIDPNLYMVNKLRVSCPRDITVCAGVAGEKKCLKYYMFNDPILNTFSKSMADMQIRRDGVKLIKVESVRTIPLKDILERYMPHGSIDLLSVDAEGLDFEIIQSNNWRKWRPRLVLVEEFGDDLDEIVGGAVYAFLRRHDYRLIGRTGPTSIYAPREEI